jgi:hypothetical protein
VVVRCLPTAKDHPERRRRKCLERLLIELEILGVTAAVLESRGTHQDSLDMKMLGHLRTQHTVSRIRLHHRTGPSDPMLWVPDACCGAIVEDRCGTPEYFSWIEGKPRFTRSRKAQIPGPIVRWDLPGFTSSQHACREVLSSIVHTGHGDDDHHSTLRVIDQGVWDSTRTIQRRWLA